MDSNGASGRDGRSSQSRSIGFSVTGASSRADRLARRAQPCRALGGVQPRIVAEPPAAAQRFAQPGRGRFVGDVADLEHRRIDLVSDLQCVAPVDEDRRLPPEHDRQARRAGEAGQPGQALGMGRHIFALMRVGARDDEALNPFSANRARRAATRPAGRLAGSGDVMRDNRRRGRAYRGLLKGWRYATCAWQTRVSVDCAGSGAPHLTGRTTGSTQRRSPDNVSDNVSIEIDPERHGFRRTGGAPRRRRPARAVPALVCPRRMERSAAALLPPDAARHSLRPGGKGPAPAMVQRSVSR